ncbi:MAG: phosphonate ABC transporter, permease protein PhnE [Betaproteobacteria bacterium]|jgi:phosphonate transport system permease protein|nr:phosphonate ABC transporter, permease protein PhnE [Betaproteobacteria bacterium]
MRTQAWGVLTALLCLVIASFATTDLQWQGFLSVEAFASMGRFLGEFVPPETSPEFIQKVLLGAWETLAMSVLGTLLAALLGMLLAILGSQNRTEAFAWARTPVQWLLNALRAIPELVWASLLLISAGLGPFAGTLALALHTAGVLGRLYAEALENAPTGPALALKAQGVGSGRIFLYATLPTILPQVMSYTLYRWENNIRAAAVLGVVGAGGLGQLLAFHLSLFQMHKTATVLLGMIGMVACVDALSQQLRKRLT